MNIRPVRLAPWAAGASPTISEPGGRIAEARAPDGPSSPSRGRRPASRCDQFAPGHEARAPAAGDDLLGEPDERVHLPQVDPSARPRPPAEPVGWLRHLPRTKPRPSDPRAVRPPRRRRPPRARCCPAGRRDCTSPTTAGSRPKQSAERIARAGAGRPPSTPRRSSAPGRRPRPSARPRAPASRAGAGCLEADFGEWTGAELQGAVQAARVAHRAAPPERFPLPRRRVVRRDAARIGTAVDRLVAAHPARSSSPCRTPIRSRLRVAQAMGSHLDLFQRIVVSPCSVSAVAYGAGGPQVLCVNSTADGLPVPKPAPPRNSDRGRRRLP